MSSRQCNNGMRCFRKDCYFKHPFGWDPKQNQYCPDKSECIREDCIMRHPNRLCNRYHCDQHKCTFQHVCRLEEAGWECPQKWVDVNSGIIVCRLAHGCIDELAPNVPNSAIAEFLQIVITTPDIDIKGGSVPNEIEQIILEDKSKDNSEDAADDEMEALANGADWGDISED